MTNVIVILLTFILMEVVAWIMHKYIMHGLFWKFHEDHHTRSNHNSTFEWNDVFFIFFSILAITSFLLWKYVNIQIFLGIGIGICLYGLTYFLVHDIFIHQRVKVFRNTKNPYLRALRRAHKIHHKKLTKEDGECFGMLWVPLKYYLAELKS